MATNDAELVIKLRADLDEANAKIKNFTKQAENQVSGLEKSFSALKIVAGAAVAAFAGGKILSGIKASIDAAKIQEDAVNSLNTSLKLAGDFSETASQDIQKFASQLQSVSTIGDETTLKLFGLAKNFGLSNEKTKELTKAAIELSAATGISLESAITNLGKSTGGLVGELGESIPALKNLSKEALQSGAAIQFVLDRFGGAAASKLQTFSGITQAIANSYGDLQEKLGDAIIKNQSVIIILNKINDLLIDLGESADNTSSAFSGFVTIAVKSLAQLSFVASEIFGGILESIASFQISLKQSNIALSLLQSIFASDERRKELAKEIKVQAEYLKKAEEFQKSVRAGRDKILELTSSAIGEIERLGTVQGPEKAAEEIEKPRKQLEKLSEEAKKTAENFAKFFEDVELSQKPLEIQIQEVGKKVTEAYNAGKFDEFKTAYQQLIDLQKKFTDGIDTEQKKREEASKKAIEASDAELKAKLDQIKKQAETDKQFVADISGGVAGGLATVLNGKDGAKQAVGAAGGALSEVFLPGSGQAVNQILQLLSGGPDQVKEQVKAFVDELPVIIEAIVEAIPVVAETLAENADIIILRLAEAMPRVAVALAEALVKVIGIYLNNAIREIGNFLTTTIGNAIQGFFDGIFKGIQQYFDQLTKVYQQVADAFKSVVNVFKPLISALEKVIDSIKGITGGGGGGSTKAAIKNITDTFTGKKKLFATGITEIPSGFPNDTFNARLTSGERVVDAGTNEGLKAAIEKINSGDFSKNKGPIVINVQLNNKQLASAIYDLNRNGYRTA